MREFGSKLLLFIACSYFLSYYELNLTIVLAVLSAVIVTGLCTYWESSRETPLILMLYGIVTLFTPTFGIYLPVLILDGIYFQKYPCVFLLGASALWSMFHIPHNLIPLYAFVLAAGILLALYCRKISNLYRSIHQIRDRSAEAEMNLRERNQALIEKQNYEIHLATLSERNRIAREIHDNVGHLLTRSILQTGAIKVINKDDTLAEPLSTLSDTLNTAMTSIRASVHDLHDESIDLEYALKDLIKETKRPAIDLTYDVEHNLPRETKYAFISIIKEAIQNMQKHSNADSAQIVLREHPGFFHLRIADNGTDICFSPTSASLSKGIGLSNMKQRVEALHGNIEFDTTDGFCILITIIKK